VFSLVDIAMPHPNVLVDSSALDDAGVYQLNDDLAIIQTVDYFTPVVDDPYAFGAITAANALSDVYAMGGTPITALNIVAFPIDKLGPEVLARILQGGADKVRESGAILLGGHSIDDSTPKFGLSVTGTIHPKKVWRNAGAQVGDHLVLTKPLGVGVVTTAIKKNLTTAEDVVEVTNLMAQLNKVAAEVGQQHTIHACTDVTGFGLLGHALEVAQASTVRFRIDAAKVPMLQKARGFVVQGAVPGGSKRNLEHVAEHVRFDAGIDDVMRTLLADAITSGGLLFSLPASESAAMVAELRARGIVCAAVIGEVIGQQNSNEPDISVE